MVTYDVVKAFYSSCLKELVNIHHIDEWKNGLYVVYLFSRLDKIIYESKIKIEKVKEEKDKILLYRERNYTRYVG